MTAPPDAGRPQICGAEIHVAARVTHLVEGAAPSPFGPMPDGGWCGLQEHPDDYPHLTLLLDCCTVRGACSGYVQHPGVCTPRLHNPRREAGLLRP